jgi:hypothetical protein
VAFHEIIVAVVDRLSAVQRSFLHCVNRSGMLNPETCIFVGSFKCFDRYEGEFQAGYAHGLGQFTSVNSGEVFIGEFFAGQRHG